MQTTDQTETREAGSCPAPCSAELELANQLEMSALQHTDNGEAQYGKPLMDAAFAIRRLANALDDANGLCRSAYQVAERDGQDACWNNFRMNLLESLKRQHAVMYPPNVGDERLPANNQKP